MIFCPLSVAGERKSEVTMCTKQAGPNEVGSMFCAGEGTRTHTHEAPDPKSGLATNYNTPAYFCIRSWTRIRIGCKDM